MKKFDKKDIKKKSENISDWYTDVILNAELADYGPARGTMVIRPYGFAIWERVQQVLDKMFKAYGVQNAYFPLFIPASLLEKEEEHLKGFSPELAVVTHGGGEKLAEPLVVRPTSETIMYHMYAKWINSWRDLPMLINQWGNAVRWEMRTYLFLRTTEFLWQEGHTAHETEEDAVKMQEAALEWYRQVYENYYAIPVITGSKSKKETFAGAKSTYTVEALMPDGKALQGATSHNLGQNFSKAFDVHFQDRVGKLDYVWQTSWGFSTRSLGGLFLVHGDDDGLVLPPKVAPVKVVILPILGKEEEKVLTFCNDLKKQIEEFNSEFVGRVEVWDNSAKTIGWKANEAELKGIPIMISIGLKEVDGGDVGINTRLSSDANRGDEKDNTRKQYLSLKEVPAKVESMLKSVQDALFEKAKRFLKENTHRPETYEEFKNIMEEKRGFIIAFWCGDQQCEEKIKEETKATTRALPLNAKKENGECIYCKKKAEYRWYFAQAY